MSNFDAEWFNCFLCDRVFSLSLSSFAQFTCILRARSIRSIDISCVSESLGRLTSKLQERICSGGGKKGRKKKERKRKGRKGKKKKEEEKKKQKRNVVELCKECAIGNEDDDDNDEQG